MMSMPNKEKKNIVLGKKEEGIYKYRTKVKFGEGFSDHISQVLQEREINKIIEKKSEELTKIANKIINKEKNLLYYYRIGKRLDFINSKDFKNVAMGSIFRRIAEESADILPMISSIDMAVRHFRFMYCIGQLEKENVMQASWDQWFEITKFKDLYKEPKLLKLVIKECNSGIT